MAVITSSDKLRLVQVLITTSILVTRSLISIEKERGHKADESTDKFILISMSSKLLNVMNLHGQGKDLDLSLTIQ